MDEVEQSRVEAMTAKVQPVRTGAGDGGEDRNAPSPPTDGLPGGDLGMATAEYAVATLAAVGFAGLLFAVLRSGEVQELLLELVRRALSTV